MTNEEALSILHCPDTVGGLYSKKYGEALNMAMEALKKESCEDCISRQAVNALVDELARAISDERCCISRGRNTATIMQDILDLPSFTPQPKTGHWIDRFPAKECKCSVCDFLICISNGSYIDMVGQIKYCPNCGAKMIEPPESEDKE